MERKTVAVFGSNSFSGSDFIDLLLETGRYNVLGISRSPEKSALFLPYLRHGKERMRFVRADLNHELDLVARAFEEHQPSYVVNFAAQSEVGPSWDHPEHWMTTNCVALANLIQFLRGLSYLERYVHISSPEVYGTCTGKVTEDASPDPSTPYAASKAAADMLLAAYRKTFNFPLLTVRATNVYGAHQQLFKIIPRSVINLRLGKTIELHGAGAAVKSYIHIRDVSRGELAILESGRVGEIYHLSPDRGYAVRDVVATICALLGKDFAASTSTVAERPGQDAAYIIDSSKARSELNWRPEISVDDGITGVVDWVGRYWTEIQQQPLQYIHTA